ncbi:MAG: NUDIX hydrolase [Patescibacteria group bacterium]
MNPESVIVPRNNLNQHVCRAVLVAPDIKTLPNGTVVNQVLLQYRPSWSKQYPNTLALPGGKMEERDFSYILRAAIQPGNLPFTLQEIIEAGAETTARELNEELGIILAAQELFYIGSKTNGAWKTHAYLAQLAEKPEVVVKPDSNGVFWMEVRNVLQGRPRMLPGNLYLARKAISQTT